MHIVRVVAVAASLSLTSACLSAEDGPRDAGTTPFHVFRVGSTNIVAIVDEVNGGTFIDTGEYGAAEALEPRLAAQGLSFQDFPRAVMTHTHHDHAGDVHGFRARGVAAWVHVDDEGMLNEGQNREAEVIGLEAALLAAIIDPSYPGADADIAFSEDFTLHDGALEVRHVGGHTAGSVVAILDGAVAFVGDLVRGGFLGGAVAANQPMVHYFHEDRARAHAALRALYADENIVEYWPSHSARLTRDDMGAFLDSLSDEDTDSTSE